MRFSKKLVALALLGVAAIGKCNAMDGEEGSRDERIPVTDDPRSVHYQPEPVPAPAEGSHWRPSSPAPAPSRAEAVQLYPFSADDRPWTLSHVQAVASSSSNMPASFQKPRVYWQIGRFTTGDGRSYGPYMIGSTRFLLQPYPLDIPCCPSSTLSPDGYRRISSVSAVRFHTCWTPGSFDPSRASCALFGTSCTSCSTALACDLDS